MKLEMSTEFMHVIEPGLYGTILGEQFEECCDEYINDFKRAVVDYGMDKINEILTYMRMREWFGLCKAKNGKLNSPQFYNFENDSIEFDLIVPDGIIEKMRKFNFSHLFFEWAKENYGSRSGFISFFPYTKEKFDHAINSSGLELSRAVALTIMYSFEKLYDDEERLEFQRDFEDDVIEEGNKNGWYVDYEED